MNRQSYWGIAALIVFVIAAGGFIYWQLSEMQQFKKQAAQETAEAEKLLRQSQKSKKVSKTGNTARQATDVTAADSDTPPAEKPITETTSVTDKTEPTQAQSNVPAQTAETETEVRVSPHGFGPYPEVPEDYPSKVEWERNPDNPDRTQELMSRVFVKLWTEGEKNFRGGGTHNGKVYPWYHNTIYVRFRTYKNADGEIVRYAGTKMSGPRVDRSGIDDWFNPPPHIRILDLESSGIYPYQYLNLR